ncbi:hypothetical protein [Leisingera sp. SS27]|uniref:hypothetical protein n=1 Tax=Leisingera sp. SS27 TaxID=2979462 RepID=UPI00232E93C5|nr:hypothetical protein [Leisingera sp. SS27]
MKKFNQWRLVPLPALTRTGPVSVTSAGLSHRDRSSFCEGRGADSQVRDDVPKARVISLNGV